MTVKELIALLQKCEPESQVLINYRGEEIPVTPSNLIHTPKGGN